VAEAKEQTKELAELKKGGKKCVRGGGIEEDIARVTDELRRKDDEIQGINDDLAELRTSQQEIVNQLQEFQGERQALQARTQTLNDEYTDQDTQPAREMEIDAELRVISKRQNVVGNRIHQLQAEEQELINQEATLRNQLRERGRERFRIVDRLRQLNVDVPTTEPGSRREDPENEDDDPMAQTQDALVGRGREEQRKVIERQTARRAARAASDRAEQLFQREDEVLRNRGLSREEQRRQLGIIRAEQGPVLASIQSQREAERALTGELEEWFKHGDYEGPIVPYPPQSPRLARRFPPRPPREPSSLRMMTRPVAEPAELVSAMGAMSLAPPFAERPDVAEFTPAFRSILASLAESNERERYYDEAEQQPPMRGSGMRGGVRTILTDRSSEIGELLRDAASVDDAIADRVDEMAEIQGRRMGLMERLMDNINLLEDPSLLSIQKEPIQTDTDRVRADIARLDDDLRELMREIDDLNDELEDIRNNIDDDDVFENAPVPRDPRQLLLEQMEAQSEEGKEMEHDIEGEFYHDYDQSPPPEGEYFDDLAQRPQTPQSPVQFDE
jgi:chromosome segregation ATPase